MPLGFAAESVVRPMVGVLSGVEGWSGLDGITAGRWGLVAQFPRPFAGRWCAPFSRALRWASGPGGP
ncbi:hypothetical protein GCM10009540_46270 [Streptomyces turgidiscabies]